MEREQLALEAIDTRDLIEELRRRKRIRVLESSTTFFNGISEDAKYMSTTDFDLAGNIVTALFNKLCIQYQDHATARDANDRPTRTMRTASLSVLIPEGVDTDD